VIDYRPAFGEALHALGARAKQLRLLRKLSQAELAKRAAVGVATIQRFETTGTAAIENVLRIAAALGAEAAFDKLFELPPYASLDDALDRPRLKTRQRAPRRP
jgi:transcriptional regulator with XRE-family HTH domain